MDVGNERLETRFVLRDLKRDDRARGVGEDHEPEALIVAQMFEDHRRRRLGVFERLAGHRAAVVEHQAERERRLPSGRLLLGLEHQGEMHHFRASAEHCFAIEMEVGFHSPTR